jgi:RNA polymerase sigma-70 factor, ECF subfamily
VGRRTGSESTPSSRTATETLVPPTSTPINRSPTLCTLSTLYGPPVADDHALVERLRAGDEEAFMDLVVRWSPSLMRVARMYVPSAAVAEEVVQETWLAALQGLDRFEERSSLRTWVFSILVNRARTRGERERRSVPFAALAREESEGDFAAVDADRFVREGSSVGAWAAPPVRWWEEPERALASGEAVERIESEIAKLPEMQRTVITMRDIEGLSSEEVRSALEISETNQRVLLHRARSKVRAALEDYYTDA